MFRHLLSCLRQSLTAATAYARPAALQAPGGLLPSPLSISPQHRNAGITDVQVHLALHGSGDANSSPHAREASILPTEAPL